MGLSFFLLAGTSIDMPPHCQAGGFSGVGLAEALPERCFESPKLRLDLDFGNTFRPLVRN